MSPLYSCIRWVPPDADNQHSSNLHVDRVLGFDKRSKSVAVISVNDPKAKIRVLETSILEGMLKTKAAKEVVLQAGRPVLTPKGEVYRDRMYEALEPFRSSDHSYLFSCSKRAALVRKIVSAGILAEPNLRKGLRRFLQGGCSRDGIDCSFGNCGKPPAGGRFAEKGKKRGRKKRNAHLRRNTAERPMDTEDHEIFDKVIKKCLFGISNRHATYAEVWRQKLPEFYNDGLGEEDPDKRSMPNQSQFTDYIETSGWRIKIKESRQTTAARNSKGKPQNSEDESLDPTAPCELYQIDSTRADVWLCVSEENKAVIGKPTVYLVVDLYTSMIVGVHVTLGNPSYHEACTGLVTAMRDKVALCAKNDIPITADDWPDTPLSKRLVADRQEFISLNSKLLGENLKIEIINPMAYSGVFKALVESKIGKLMKYTWSFPGGDDPLASKDEAPAVLDAALTLKMFTKLLLIAIIKINARTKKDMVLPEGTFDKKIVKSPAGVMKWMLDNNMGLGLAASLEKVERELLPEVERARTYPRGIRVSANGVNGIFYDAGKNLPIDYFRDGNRVKLDVQFDPGSMNHVWVRDPETKVIFKAPISKRSREYRNLTWEEGALLQKRRDTDIDETEISQGKTFKKLDKIAQETLDHSKQCALSQPKTYRSAILKNQTQNRLKARHIEISIRNKTKNEHANGRPKFDMNYET